ncbi:MAG: CoA transferase [Rhodospirillales bacterium]|nr:CoA transferase [Rhodospirillales bacterium]
MRPLEGFRVLALEHAVAAPICTRHLADLGAEIVKIERPGGGDFARGYDRMVHGQSSFFVWLNRGKRSVTLDAKDATGRAVLARLAERSDVVVQNLAPGAAARLGLSYAALSARNPAIVVCDISGYGATGPYAQKKAYDLLIQAESGLISVTGTPETPSRVGISIADIATGMYAQTAVLAALLRRERGGGGAHVSVAMLDALAEWMMHPMYRWAYDGTFTPRVPTGHPLLAPYGAHRTKDGSVIFGLQNEREWITFCTEVMENPALATDLRFASNIARGERREELTTLLEAAFAHITTAELVAKLDRAGIANGRQNGPREIWEHPQLSARDRWRETMTEAGPVRALLPPVTFADTEAQMGPVPALGADTDAVLTEAGYDRAAIAALRASGTV